MIYFRLCFSFSCYGYDLTLIKKSLTLNFYSFLLLLVTVVAQFTAKTTNSEKAIYFLSLISCSINKLKSHILFTCKSLTKLFMLFDLTWKKIFLLQEMVGGWRLPALPPFLYGPFFDAMFWTRDLKSSSFYHFYVERQYHNITFDFRKWRNY